MLFAANEHKSISRECTQIYANKAIVLLAFIRVNSRLIAALIPLQAAQLIQVDVASAQDADYFGTRRRLHQAVKQAGN
jgi:hypothetical protein